MAGYLGAPRRLILTPWVSHPPVTSKSPSFPVAQSPTGVAVFPAPLYYLRSRQWKGKGAGTTKPIWRQGKGRWLPGTCSPGAWFTHCGNWVKNYNKDGGPFYRSAAVPAGRCSPQFRSEKGHGLVKCASPQTHQTENSRKPNPFPLAPPPLSP